jgi:hypothetical protein
MSVRRLSRLALAVSLLGTLAVAASSSAADKPGISITRGGTTSTSGKVVTMDAGRAWTPGTCKPANPEFTGQCDVIPLKVVVPKGYPEDAAFTLDVTLSWEQKTPLTNLQVVGFDSSSNSVTYDPSKAPEGHRFVPQNPYTQWIFSPRGGSYFLVVDQRQGYDTPYKLTVKWVDVSQLTRISAVVKHGPKATIIATLKTEKGAAVAGQPVVFSVAGKPIGTAKTNAQGVATLAGVKPGQTVKVAFNGVKEKFASSSTTVKS